MYELIIIFSFSAKCFASFVGFTLKAIRTAFDETGNLISALHTLKSLENKVYANLLPPLELLSQNKKDELIKKLKELGVLNDKNMAA